MRVEPTHLLRAASNSVRAKETSIPFNALLFGLYLQPGNLMLRVELSVISIFFFICFFQSSTTNTLPLNQRSFCNVNVFNFFFFVQERLLNVPGSLLPTPIITSSASFPNYHLSQEAGSAFSSWKTHGPVQTGCVRSQRGEQEPGNAR